jgi:hypothetical protein
MSGLPKENVLAAAETACNSEAASSNSPQQIPSEPFDADSTVTLSAHDV